MKISDFDYDIFRHPHHYRTAILAVLAFVGVALGGIFLDIMSDHAGWIRWAEILVFITVLCRFVDPHNDSTDRDSKRKAIFEKYKCSYDEKSPQKTIDLLDTAIVLDPNAPWRHALRGLIFDSQKEFNKAEQDFNKLVSLCPFNRFAYWWRGYFYEGHKRYELALNDYRKARLLGAERRSIDTACQRAVDGIREEKTASTSGSGEPPPAGQEGS